ncbi:hypothetical protein LEN26_005320 [Aphanomyces euteiches]|nr:hypothetical protein LEN26_005320 [Aphanomyces euteiches]
MEAPFTANDFYYAIVSSAKHKAPGPDGLPVEYYMINPHDWARVVEVRYADQLTKGRMSKFQRRAHLSLLYKSGPRLTPGNHRPLTLLNCDAKLGPKILSYRLGKVLPHILHSDQYGFIPGRSIQQALFEFSTIQQHCRNHNLDNAGAILLDFVKAFDSVQREVLDTTLKHLNFGHTFRQWIKAFYKGTLIYLLFNGKPLQPFELGCGVRQGDPLSPGLFVLFIEPMLNLLRASIPGVAIGNTSHTTIAFADDCTGILNDLADAPKFLKIVDSFCKATGMKLNLSKTHAMSFSPWSDSQLPNQLATLGINIIPTNGQCKLLGIYFGPNMSAERRLDHILPTFHHRCLLWRYRARTLRGRVAILRSIILPLLWYTTTVTSTPPAALNRFTPSLLDFLNNKLTTDIQDTASRCQFPRAWCSLPRSQGGLPPLLDTVHSLQLNLFLSGLRQIRSTPTTSPKWMNPAISIFTDALDGYGYGLDILHYPMTTPIHYGINHTGSKLGPYLHQTRLAPSLMAYPIDYQLKSTTTNTYNSYSATTQVSKSTNTSHGRHSQLGTLIA